MNVNMCNKEYYTFRQASNYCDTIASKFTLKLFLPFISARNKSFWNAVLQIKKINLNFRMFKSLSYNLLDILKDK